MDLSVIITIIAGIIVAIAGWLVQQYLKPFLPKRERRISDKEMLKVWHDHVFKRQTFEGKLYSESFGYRDSDLGWFVRGIEETIRALETGDCRYRFHPGERTKGANCISDKDLKDKTNDVIERLKRIRQIMKDNRDDIDKLSKYSSIIDEEKDKIFDILNPFWKKYGMEPLRTPSTVLSPTYKRI